jgi:hypothetical protein
MQQHSLPYHAVDQMRPSTALGLASPSWFLGAQLTC